jgi:hypothetical protein
VGRSILGGVVVFSLVEAAVTAVGFVVWQNNRVLGLIVWAVGYTVEHIIANNVQKGRPALSFPPAL